MYPWNFGFERGLRRIYNEAEYVARLSGLEVDATQSLFTTTDVEF
jgi:hypothetical protein